MAPSHIAVAWHVTFLTPRCHEEVRQNPTERGKEKTPCAKACESVELQQVVVVTAISLHGTAPVEFQGLLIPPWAWVLNVIEEDTPCVWPPSCGQWLGSHSQANSKQAAQHPGKLWQWTPCCEGTCRYFWNITTEKRAVLAWTLWEQDLSHLWSICRSYWSWYQFADVNRTDIFQCPENSAQHYELGNTFLWSVL